MNRYYLDNDAYIYLNQWSQQHHTAAVWSPHFFKKAEVILKGLTEYHFYVEAVKGRFKFNMNDASGIVFSGSIVHDPTGENDFGIRFRQKRDLDEDTFSVYSRYLEIFANAYLLCNSFMWIGDYAANKEYIAAGRNEDGGKTITFRKYRETVYAIPIGSHRSPEGVFSVRGHFRHYRSGKVIWIDEYMKGTQ